MISCTSLLRHSSVLNGAFWNILGRPGGTLVGSGGHLGLAGRLLERILELQDKLLYTRQIFVHQPVVDKRGLSTNGWWTKSFSQFKGALTDLRSNQEISTGLLLRSWHLLGGPKLLQESPKATQGCPKATRDCPKSAPRPSPDSPRPPKIAPRSSQDRSRSAPRPPKIVQGSLQDRALNPNKDCKNASATTHRNTCFYSTTRLRFSISKNASSICITGQ